MRLIAPFHRLQRANVPRFQGSACARTLNASLLSEVMFAALRAFDKSEMAIRRVFGHFGEGRDAGHGCHSISAPLAEAEVVEGRSRDNGVDYWFCARRRPWFGRYECRVNRCFLDGFPKEFCTYDFEMAGCIWQLKLIIRRHGQISSYLVSKNESPVDAHFSVTVIHKRDPRKNIVLASRETFGPGAVLGFSHLTTVFDIKPHDSGFVCGDSFALQIDIRRDMPENEDFSVLCRGRSCTCTWKLLDALESSPYALKSKEFRIGPSRWFLSFLPNGSIEESQKVGAFVYCTNSTFLRAKFRLTIPNHCCHRRDRSGELVHSFQQGLDSRGWSRFMPKRMLQNPKLGFLEDGWITLTVHISVYESSCPLPLLSNDTSSSGAQEETPKCVVCLEKEQTAGFVHGKTTHKCVCAKCCEMVFRQRQRCPVCAQKADSILIGYY